MSQHVYPLEDAIDHITDCSGFCWCEPTTRKLCPECEAKPEAELGCYRCEGTGTVDAEEGDIGPFIFVHFRSDEEGAEEIFLEDSRNGRLHGIN